MYTLFVSPDTFKGFDSIPKVGTSSRLAQLNRNKLLTIFQHAKNEKHNQGRTGQKAHQSGRIS